MFCIVINDLPEIWERIRRVTTGNTIILVWQNNVIYGGGGGGIQAYNFGNFDFEIWVEGESQDTSRHF